MSTRKRLDLDPLSSQALEFDELLRIVAGHARTAAGAQAVLDLRPFAEEQDLQREINLVREVGDWSLHEAALVPAGLPGAHDAATALRVEGAKLDASPLRDLCTNLAAVARMRTAILSAGRHVDLLAAFVEPLPDLSESSAPVLAGIDPDGRIADGASKRLAEVRGRRTRVAGRLRRKLETLLRDPAAAGVIQDEFVTQRNGRYVIPVRTDAAQPVRGIVHATSSSGATRFVEPLDSVELNNELVELDEAEREEEDRILREWGAALRERLPAVETCLRRLAELDALQARARYGEHVGAVRPRIETGGPIRLRGLRHPLLEAHLAQSGGRCIPLDLDLDPADRILVVSGPNTGGKTVALKNLGLAVLMAQSGIPVNADEAVLPRYGQVRADVGDHQSIAADLSTFSAHVTAMASFLADRDPPALFLFDEIGGGTDPAEGAALALAVLENLAGDAVTIVATTHQNTLKHWAFGDARAASAAMEFDDRTLQPTYRVLPDVVGHSAALDIAARCGLSNALIGRARDLLGEEAGRSEAYLAKLRERLAELDEERSRLVEKQAQIEAARSDLERRAAEEEEQRKKRTALRLDREIAVFRRQARQALASMRDDAERRRAERKAGAAERSLKASRARAVARDGAQEPSSKPEKLEVGLKVHVRSLGRQGTVRRVDGKRVELELGRIGVTVDADDLRLPGGEAAERPRRAARSRSVARDLETAPPLELMLVGQTVDEALDAIDRFLDDAVLGAIREVRLIHGHGTGRLRRGVREHLRRHPLVRDQRPGSESEGGDGATVVRLK